MTIGKIAARARDSAAAAGQSEEAMRQAADDSICAMMLIRTYRVRGHLAADLDPLGLAKRDLPDDLTPEFHGFTGDALDRPVYLGGALGLEQGTVDRKSHTSELQSLMRISYAVFCLKKKTIKQPIRAINTRK